ncbi:YjbH domain-containing protein [Psychromonas sp. KJ10-10]|uniref:YjbH domain-containing protein n=1 Tax=Psychromonas sp. KJ10-10 TaxID=3391823 RepID=UPI0039B525AD
MVIFLYFMVKAFLISDEIADLDNIFFSVGLFPGLEVGGRIVTKTYDTNLYIDSNGGIRDLSASLKYQIPYIYDYSGINLALGIQDAGGATNNFEAYYGVADYAFDAYPIRLSAGYGKSKLSNDILNGAFGLIEAQPFSFMRLLAEYDASKINSAVKLFTPEGLLPLDSQLALQYQIQTGHDDSSDDNQHMWSINATVPLLGFGFEQPDYISKNNYLTTQDLVKIEQEKSDIADLNALKKALQDEGFLNIRVAYNNNKLFIALESRRYNHNQIDGVGVALGIISSYAGAGLFSDLEIDDPTQNFELYVLNNGIPMLKVDTSASCYRTFITSGEACGETQFQSSDVQLAYQNVSWLDETINSGFGRSQVILSPALQHRDATEYGVFDYSLALATNLYTPLWKGVAIDIRHFLPISNSDDFDDDNDLWGSSRFESEIDRALIHQAFQVPYNIMTQFSGGYIAGDYIGLMNESSWTSETGRHSVGLELGEFSYIDDTDSYGNSVDNLGTRLASYQLSVPEWDWQFKATAGQFMQADFGMRLTTSHWLGDVRLDATYQRTTADGASEAEQFVSLGLAIPLTLWRDMSPGYVQVRGIDQFNYALQTRVGNTHNNLSSGLGNNLDLQHSLSRQYQNRERLSVLYLEQNEQRLRNAYLRYLDQVN